ncbi:unnamed protein product [Brassicogethes aeneus]|uniref:Uncharacterized protein n=1 Tax=Brassicogethes aeneus TaxID=1431903 RepID=A0A9P0B3J5_BRAAE|nr:unnamed protein product [Brassicogethes aeneus]
MGDSTQKEGDLPKDYNSLLKEHFRLKKVLDSFNQELYDSKRQLKVAEALQIEYQSEIEHLQHEQNFGDQQLKISRLEEDIIKCRLIKNERISYLEQCLEDKESECNNLREENKVIKKACPFEPTVDDSSKLLEEINLLKEANEDISDIVNELSETLKESQKNCSDLEGKIESLQNEYESVKGSLECKREELEKANDLVQQLNDEILCLKKEIESSKSVPLDQQSQGNSLFAEVDDRRVVLQKSISTMKREYEEMTNDRVRLLHQINKLTRENLMLLERWSEEECQRTEDEEMVMDSYREQIANLKKQVATYKKEISYKTPDLQKSSMCEVMQFYEKKLKEKTREIYTLNNDLTNAALTHTLLTNNLASANKTARKCKLKVCQLECETDILMSKLEELGVSTASMKEMGLKTQKAIQRIEKEHNEQVEKEISAKMSLQSIVKENDMLYNTLDLSGLDAMEINETLNFTVCREIEIEMSNENIAKEESVKENMLEDISDEKTLEYINLEDVKEVNETPSEEIIILDDDFKDEPEIITLDDDEEVIKKEIKSEPTEECFVIFDDKESHNNVKVEIKENINDNDNKENQSTNKENHVPLKPKVLQDNIEDHHKENAEPKKENLKVKILKEQNLPKASGIPTKKVTFSHNTVEPKTTDRDLIRKGGKIVKAKRTFYF